MTRSRLTLLASALLTTACGQLLEASPDGFSFKPPLTNLCTAGTSNEGGSAGSANSAGSGGRAGQAGSISTTGGNGGASSGSGGASAGSAGTSGQGGFAGGSAGAAGFGGPGGEGGASGQAGGGGSGTAGGGGAAGGGTTSPYDTITSTEFTPFQQTPLTGVVGDLAVVSTGKTSFQVFARDATTHLISTASYATTKDSWDGWTELLLGGQVDSTPAATFDGFGDVLHVFARQGQPIVNFFQPSEEEAWSSHPVNDPSSFVVTSPPAAIRWTNKRPQVFAVSADGSLLMANVSNESITPWQILGGGLAPETAPAVVRDDDGVVDIFVRKADDTLSRCHLLIGQITCFWEPWQGVTLETSPAVSSWAAGRLDVVVRDTTSGQLRYRALREDGMAPAWTPLPVVTSVGAPSVVALGRGKLRVLVHDSDGKVFMASLKP